MRIIYFFSAVFVFIFSILLVIGIISGPEVSLESETTIVAPESVVFNVLSGIDKYAVWNSHVKKSRCDRSVDIRDITYSIGGRELTLTEKCRIENRENTIHFSSYGDPPDGTFIRNMQNSIRLTNLTDGSTQVNWSFKYTVSPVTAKTISRFVVKSHFEDMLQNSLDALKKHIEG